MIKILTLAFVFMYFSFSYSQDLAPGFKFWESTGIDWRINDKVTFKFSQLFAFNLKKPSNLQFAQTDIGIFYRPKKLLEFGGGYKPMFFSLSGGANLFSQFYTDFIFRHDLFHLPIKHTLTAEIFLPKFPKYKYRFHYSVNYYFKNKLLPFNMKPFIKGQVYYYLNGSKNRYYDNSGIQIARQSPNDFHRFRVGGGITSKPLPYLRATIYYFYQQEFNTSFTTNREINIPNQSQTTINDPFNNYHVVGLELEFILKSKQKTKSKAKFDTD